MSEDDIKELKNIESAYFSSNVVEDYTFTNQDLVSGILYIKDFMPGSITILDNRNETVVVQQSEKIQNNVCVGVNIDLSSFDVFGTWTVLHSRGQIGPIGSSTSSIPPSDQILKYALIFG